MKRGFILLAVCLLLSGCGRMAQRAPESGVPTVGETIAQLEETASPAAEGTQVLETEPPEESIPPETEPAESLPEPADEDFVRVLDYIDNARQSLPYATEENFTGEVIYDFTEAYLRYGTVKKLTLAAAELEEQGIGILIWDGFRPQSAQEKLWEICPDPAYVSHPVTGSRSHCRGNTVDLTLVDLMTGELLPMPTGYDDFSAKADRDYSDCLPEETEYALLLEQTMEKYGFKPYSAEWWHFSDLEKYPIDESFSPADLN